MSTPLPFAGEGPSSPLATPGLLWKATWVKRTEDEEILQAVQALQAGAGPDAFEPIFTRYYRPLYLFFANRPALREEADDLAQTTLFRAFENIHQCRSEEGFEAWLWQIGQNVWRNAVRDRQALKRGPETETLDEPGEHGEILPAGVVFGDVPANPEEVALLGERIRILRAAIEGLPPGMRQCAELRLFADLKYREIAELTGSGLNTVRSQLFEARKRLKPVLDEYFQGVGVEI